MPDELNPSGVAQNVRVLDFGHTESNEEAFIDETIDWSQAEPQYPESGLADLLDFAGPSEPAPIAGATFEQSEPYIHLVANTRLGVLDVALGIEEAEAIIAALDAALDVPR